MPFLKQWSSTLGLCIKAQIWTHVVYSICLSGWNYPAKIEGQFQTAVRWSSRQWYQTFLNSIYNRSQIRWGNSAPSDSKHDSNSGHIFQACQKHGTGRCWTKISGQQSPCWPKLPVYNNQHDDQKFWCTSVSTQTKHSGVQQTADEKNYWGILINGLVHPADKTGPCLSVPLDQDHLPSSTYVTAPLKRLTVADKCLGSECCLNTPNSSNHGLLSFHFRYI